MDDLHDDLAAHVADELAPLSDARLADLTRQFCDAAARLYNALDDNLIDSGGVDEFNVINNCFDALLDETKRRREREAALLNLSRVALDNHQRREAALLAVVRAVDHYGSPCSCPDTEAPHWHEADCPVAQARAALADADAGKE